MLTEEELDGNLDHIHTMDDQIIDFDRPSGKEKQRFDSSEEFKSLPDFNLKDKYNYLKNKLSAVLSEKDLLENELAKAKIRWADVEL